MRGRFPSELIDEIRERTDIVDLIESYIPLRKQGRNYTALCPFHTEDTPSFSVSPDKQMFYCFGCQKGGGVIDFVMDFEHLSFPEALEKLAQRAGVALPEQELTPAEQRAYQQRNILHEINGAAAAFYMAALAAGGEGAAYLERRGITAEMRKKFQLGYATPQWDDLKNHLTKKGFQEKDLLRAGVLSKSEGGKSYDRFRGRLMFPIGDQKGKIIAFGGRVLDDGLPKYLNSAENPLFHKSYTLYGLHLAILSLREYGEAVLMEGYLDVISAHQFGITNAVAPLGTAFTAEQAKLLKRYCQRILLAYDGDSAGRKATLRALTILDGLDMRSRVLHFPAGYDPDDYLRRYGRDQWDALSAEAPSGMEYRIDVAFQNHNCNKAEGKADIITELTPALRAVKDLVTRTEYIRLISRKLDIDTDLLMLDLRRQQISHNSPSLRESLAPTARRQQGLVTAKEFLCRYAVNHSQAFDEIEATCQWDFLETAPEREIIALIREHRATFRWTYQSLLDLATEEQREHVLAFSMAERESNDIDEETLYHDCWRKVEKERLKISLKSLEMQINDEATQQDTEKLTRLLRKFSEIQQELREK